MAQISAYFMLTLYTILSYFSIRFLLEPRKSVNVPNIASKKEETTCIGNGNSGENPTRRAGATARQERFNGKRARKNRYGVPRFPDFLCYGFFDSPNVPG